MVVVGRLSRELQFVIGLYEQILGLLGMTFHIPFVGPLRCGDLLPGFLAQPLGGSEIRMVRGGNILFWSLGDGKPSDDEQGT